MLQAKHSPNSRLTLVTVRAVSNSTKLLGWLLLQDTRLNIRTIKSEEISAPKSSTCPHTPFSSLLYYSFPSSCLQFQNNLYSLKAESNERQRISPKRSNRKPTLFIYTGKTEHLSISSSFMLLKSEDPEATTCP